MESLTSDLIGCWVNWAIAYKYNFWMPPYYTLLLRSFASFEGLAIARDLNFNTFEDSYPYVVRKLLSDNSLDTRKILHNSVFIFSESQYDAQGFYIVMH
ncbi:hypothetical protein Tco_1150113 [Tanacetum coccineum]